MLSIDPITVDSGTYHSLKLTDLPTVYASGSASLTTYSMVIRSSFKTGHDQSFAP